MDGEDLKEALDNITNTLAFFVSGFQEAYAPPDTDTAALNTSCCSSGLTALHDLQSASAKASGGQGHVAPNRAHWAPIVAKWTVKLLGNCVVRDKY